jgi:hypothetical protein
VSVGRIIRPKVYIEGVEVPCYKVIVQTSIGGPSQAMIDVPPVEEFFDRYVEDPPQSGKYVQKMGIQPRTLVHVFYEDTDDPDGVPRLLFEGEFVRYEYSKTPERRAITMVAKDITNILSSVYVRYYSDFFTPYGNLMSIFTGQAISGRPNSENIKLSLIGAGTSINAEIMAALKDDVGGWGIAKVFRDIARKGLGTNTFFAGFENRTKVTKKIVALADTKSRKLLDATQLASLLQQNMSSLKESATIWDLYSMLMGMVFYFPVPISAPPFITNAVINKGSANGSPEFVAAEAQSLMSMLIKPYTWFTAPPNFNVIFPSQLKSFSMRRDFLSEPTRIIMSAFGVLQSLAKEELGKAAPSQFMFVAPRQLAQRWDREAYDSKLKKQEEAFGPIGTEEHNLSALLEKQRIASISIGETKLPADQKKKLADDIKKLTTEVAESKTKIKGLYDDVTKQNNIKDSATEDGRKREVQARLWNRNVMTDQDNVSLECREDLKGIVFGFDYMSSTQVEVTKSKNIDPVALQNYMSAAADFKLTVQQHQSRIAELSLHFCPHLVAGFPALVVDQVRNFFGEVDVVTHIIDANGIADTQVQISFVRNNELEFAELARNTPGKVQFPSWINPLYLPENVGNEVYSKLFPENRPDKSKPGINAARSILRYADKGLVTQVAAADRIRKLYLSAKDRDSYASAFTRRNIASADQTFLSVMKASKAGKNYIFNAFDSDRFRAAMVYAASAGKVQSFAESDMSTGDAKATPGGVTAPSVAIPASSASTVAEPEDVAAISSAAQAQAATGLSAPIPDDLVPAQMTPLQRSAEAAAKISLETNVREAAKEILTILAVAKAVEGPAIVKTESFKFASDPKIATSMDIVHNTGGIRIHVLSVQLLSGQIETNATLFLVGNVAVNLATGGASTKAGTFKGIEEGRRIGVDAALFALTKKARALKS